MSADRRVAVGVFFLVFAMYVLTYTGAFKSNDERAMFSGADSFLKRGAFTTNQIYWDYTHVGMFTTNGDMVPNYEPAQMVLAIPLYLWGRALGAAVQGVMFFGALVMAGAAALVYLCLLELAYGRRGSMLGSLVFAFATAAWPYSRSFFREPLAVLAYLLVIYALLRYRAPARRGWVWPAVAGAGLGLALQTKQIAVALIPAMVVWVWAYERGRGSSTPLGGRAAGETGPAPAGSIRRERWIAAAAFLMPLGILVLLGRVYSWTTLSGVTAFARDVVDFTTNPQLSSSAPIRLLRASLGLTVSPYKGLLWFSPVLLLGLAGAVPFVRRHRWEGIALLLVIGAHLLGYSRYLYWSGGVTWGSRYMLQVVPFLVLLGGPVWAWLAGGREAASDTRRTSVWQMAAWGLIALSVAVQAIGMAVDYRTYEVNQFLLQQAKVWGGIGEAIDALYMNPAYSPVVGHLKLLFAGTQPLDMAWVRLQPEGKWEFVGAGLGWSLLLVGMSIAALVAIWRQPRWTKAVGTGMAVASIAVCSILLTTYREGDARFDPYGVAQFLKPMMGTLDEASCTGAGGAAHCGDALIMPDPTLTDYFLNALRAPLVWYGVEQGSPIDARLMEQLALRYGQIWLARDRSASSDDQEGRREWEKWLAQHAYKLDETRFEDWARLVRFSAAGRQAEVSKPDAHLGVMVLEETVLSIENTPPPSKQPAQPQLAAEPLDDGKVQAKTGDTLQIGLAWRANERPGGNYTAFVQLLDEGNQVKVQRDRWPGDGMFPTGELSAGQVITDNLALPLDLPAGIYRLIAGMYRADETGMPRLTGPQGDFATLAEVDIR